MKTPAIFSLLTLAILMSCDTETPAWQRKGESNISYTESLATWRDLRDQHGNDYVYQTYTSSWIGVQTTTTLTVTDGVVVRRDYERQMRNDAGQYELTLSYSETSGDVGSHEEGAEPVTIDKLYQTCVGKYLNVDENRNQIYFDTEETGIMTNCGYTPDNCQDDCYTGFRIEFLEWTN